MYITSQMRNKKYLIVCIYEQTFNTRNYKVVKFERLFSCGGEIEYYFIAKLYFAF